MKPRGFILALSLAFTSGAAWGASDVDVVKVFVTAVEQGHDLASEYPGALGPAEIASLRRVAACPPVNFMKQSRGHYTVVWNCKKDVLGMEVVVADGKVAAVSVFSVVAVSHRVS